MGVASKKSCQTIEEEMSRLRKQMRLLFPSPQSREKRPRIAKDSTPGLNLEGVSNALMIYHVHVLLHATQDVASLQTCTAFNEQTHPRLQLSCCDAKTSTVMTTEISNPCAPDHTDTNATSKCLNEHWNPATVPWKPVHVCMIHGNFFLKISPYLLLYPETARSYITLLRYQKVRIIAESISILLMCMV